MKTLKLHKQAPGVDRLTCLECRGAVQCLNTKPPPRGEGAYREVLV